MGKSLRDLLEGFQFIDEKLNPRNVKEDMLSSNEISREINIPGLSVGGVKLPYDRQYSLLTNNIVDIYGADAPRILLRGKVDTKKATKKIVNRVAKIAGGIFGNKNAVGSFVRNSISGLVTVRQPSDTISQGLFSAGKSTETGLYADIINGRVNNSINPITGLLTQFRTPSQFKAGIGDFSNGKVKIGGAVVDTLTNESFKGLGWAAAKIGLGMQDAGKTKSLSQTLKDSTNSNSTDTTKFPSLFAEVKAKFGNSKIKPTGIITGQGQFSKLGNFPNMYDDSPVKTGLILDGIPFKLYGNRLAGTIIDDYLTKNPSEDFKKSGIFSPYGNGDTIDAESGDRLKPQIIQFGKKIDYNLGFNNNTANFGSRNQTFSAGLGINDGYNLKDGLLTNQRNELEDFLIVRDGNEGMYKIPNIIKDGKPTRFFSQKVVDDTGKIINDKFFGGYKNRSKANINGDHRLKSALALASNATSGSTAMDAGNDLIKMRFGYGSGKEKQFTHLLSNITGFTDTPTVSWGEARPIGSPHKFYFYESFEREVSFKTQIYASSQEELPLVWQKANAIMMLTKGFSNGVVGIAGKICSLRIGDMFDSDFGFITSCTLTVPDISPWEIKDGSQLPFVCEMDISYKVIEIGSNFYKDLKSPEYKFNDFPNISELPKVNVDELLKRNIPRPQMSRVDLVKLPNPTREGLTAETRFQREIALNPLPTEQDDILAQQSTRNQRLREIENIRASNLANGGFGEYSDAGIDLSDFNRN